MGPALLVQIGLVVASLTSLALVVSSSKRALETRRDPGHIVMRRNAGLAGLLPAALFCASFAVGPIMKAGHANALPTCLARTRNLCTGLLMYAQDSDAKFPPCDAWSTPVQSYVGKAPLACPSSHAKYGYSMNAALAGLGPDEVETPVNTVLVFESGQNRLDACGGAQDLTQEDRHGGTLVFGTCDGTPVPASKKRRAAFLWAAKAAAPGQ